MKGWLWPMLSLGQPQLCGLVALADAVRFFGRDGSPGSTGSSGRAGAAGAPQTLWADGQPQPVYAVGRDGEDGGDGQTGQSGYCDPQPRQVRHDLQAAGGAVIAAARIWTGPWKPVRVPRAIRAIAVGRSGSAVSRASPATRGQILALLAPGSQVASAGQEYLGRVEGEGQLVWAAPRSPQTLGSLGVTLTIQDSGAIAFTFPSDLWVLGERNETEILTSFRVTQAVLAPDATQLAWGSWSGQNSSLTLAVLDLAGVSDYVNSEFHLTLASRDPRTDRGGDRRYRTRFQGPLPTPLISRQQNRFELALGRLPLDLRDRQGDEIRLELQVTRSLGPYSAIQTLEWLGQW